MPAKDGGQNIGPPVQRTDNHMGSQQHGIFGDTTAVPMDTKKEPTMSAQPAAAKIPGPNVGLSRR